MLILHTSVEIKWLLPIADQQAQLYLSYPLWSLPNKTCHLFSNVSPCHKQSGARHRRCENIDCSSVTPVAM